MLSREEIEQLIDQKIEPLTEEIAALKAQLGKVDLLVIDNRNIRQSLGRLEAGQEALRINFERQEKRTTRFEKQVNDQFTELKTDVSGLKTDVGGLKTDVGILKDQMSLVVTMLRRIVPPEEER